MPSTSIIATESSKHGKSQNVQVRDGLFILLTGQIWIPQKATDLQIRLFIIGHTSVHRGQSAAVSTLESRLYWETLEEDA